jgi:hypothetical protein
MHGKGININKYFLIIFILLIVTKERIFHCGKGRLLKWGVDRGGGGNNLMWRE